MMACFSEVKTKELEIIEKRRTRIRKTDGFRDSGQPANSNLFGLALSGGGIRSAVTNLGLLQGLARIGVLRIVDLLSTVSGGGYIGACLISILSARCAKDRVSSLSLDATPSQPLQLPPSEGPSLQRLCNKDCRFCSGYHPGSPTLVFIAYAPYHVSLYGSGLLGVFTLEAGMQHESL